MNLPHEQFSMRSRLHVPETAGASQVKISSSSSVWFMTFIMSNSSPPGRRNSSQWKERRVAERNTVEYGSKNLSLSSEYSSRQTDRILHAASCFGPGGRDSPKSQQHDNDIDSILVPALTSRGKRLGSSLQWSNEREDKDGSEVRR